MGGFFRNILYVTLFTTLLVGCEGYDYDILEEQQELIVEYLESTHSPNLMSEADAKLSLDNEPQFYTRYGTYAYRYISTYYDAGRDDMAEITSGSVVTISFDIYEFTGDEIDSDDLPVYSNRLLDKLSYEEAGLNTEYWDFTPLEIRIGSDGTLSSIQDGLIGCRDGDEIEIYLTYNMVYGDDIIGLVAKQSPIRFSCTIDSVE